MFGKLDLPGFRARKTELKNQVYIQNSEVNCMTEVVMPAVMRDAQPELALYYALRKVRELDGKDLDSLPQQSYAELTPLQYSVLLAHPHIREALADRDQGAVAALAESYTQGDFISINHGAISSTAFIEALKNSHRGRIPLNWYQNELRNNVNSLGVGAHVEIPLQGNTVQRGSQGKLLYSYTSPLVKPILVERGSYLINQFQDPRKVALLPPLSLEQYASDGLACFSAEYTAEHQSSPPMMDPITRMMSIFLGAAGIESLGSEQLTERSHPPGLPPELAQLLGRESLQNSGKMVALPNGTSVVLIDLGEILLDSRKKR
ncbi:hypothetical protein HYT52_04920 [Candidatus Woesearchaeota archaeon]|nr:hypothetical protein [Candidatus Woesearchaeota archaeon]